MVDIQSQKKCIEKQKEDLDNILNIIKIKVRELEVINTETEIKKQHLVKIIKKNRRKEQMKTHIKSAKQSMEDGPQQKPHVEIQDRVDKQRVRLVEFDRTRKILHQTLADDNIEIFIKNKINTEMQKIILEIEEVRRMLSMIKENKVLRGRICTKETNQTKWLNFQSKKEKRKLDQCLEKTLKERDEVEIIKTKTQQQREEFEQKVEDTVERILTISELKTYIEKVATEMNNAREEMLKTKNETQNYKEEVKNYMVSNSVTFK